MYCLNLDYGNALKNAPGYLDIYEENYEINLNDATKDAPSIVEFGVLS